MMRSNLLIIAEGPTTASGADGAPHPKHFTLGAQALRPNAGVGYKWRSRAVIFSARRGYEGPMGRVKTMIECDSAAQSSLHALFRSLFSVDVFSGRSEE